jgi:hypothetical protein
LPPADQVRGTVQVRYWSTVKLFTPVVEVGYELYRTEDFKS